MPLIAIVGRDLTPNVEGGVTTILSTDDAVRKTKARQYDVVIRDCNFRKAFRVGLPGQIIRNGLAPIESGNLNLEGPAGGEW
ncbi:MAG: hypothetical protein WCX63_02255 [Methanoregula sp.]